MKLKIIFIMLFVCMIFSLSTVCADSVEGDDFNNVTDAIDEANEGDVVQLDGMYTIRNKTATLEKSVTLEGSPKAKITFSEFNSSLKITSRDFSFKNVEFDFWNFEVQSGNTNLLFDNCTFSRLSVTFSGNGNLTIVNSNFINSHIYNSQSGSITVQNSNLTSDYGGFFINDGGNADFNVSKCNFAGDCPIYLGDVGDLYLLDNVFNSTRTVISVKSSNRVNISRNVMKNAEKIISISSKELLFDANDIENCIDFGEVQASKLNVSNTILKNSRTFNIEVGEFDLCNSIFENISNIYIGAVKKLNIVNSRAIKSDFVNWGDNYCDVYVYKSSFKESDIYRNIGKVNVLYSNFTDGGSISSSKGANVDGCNFVNTAWVELNGNAVVKNSNFTNNYREFEFGKGKTLTIENCIFQNNTGDMLLSVSKDTTTVSNCRFIDNRLNSDLLYLLTNSLICTGNVFSNNICKDIIYVDCTANFKNDLLKVSENIIVNNRVKNGKSSVLYFMFDTEKVINPMNLVKKEITNNFYGFNVRDAYQLGEIFVQPNYATSVWVNLNLKSLGGKDYELRFTNNKGKTVSLSEYSFSLKNKKTGEIIASNLLVKNGVCKFSLNDTLDVGNVYIISPAGSIVNNPPAKLTVTSSGSYYNDYKITVKAYDSNGNPIKNKDIKLVLYQYSGNKCYEYSNVYKLNGNGQFVFKEFEPEYGRYNLKVMFGDSKNDLTVYNLKNIKIKKMKATVSFKYIPSSKGTLGKFKISSSYKKAKNVIRMNVKIYRNSKVVRSFSADSDVLGDFIASHLRQLHAGAFTILLGPDKYEEYTFAKKTLKVTVGKVLKVKAAKMKAKAKKSKYFKVNVKLGKKPVKNIKVKVKVFTGKKSKTYNIKTNAKGLAKLNTKKIRKGSHNVEVSISNSQYYGFCKSKITIK